MKKKVLITVVSFISLFFCAFLFSSSEAEASINPDCPNGCVENGDKCLCHGWNYGLREANWGSSTVITHPGQ